MNDVRSDSRDASEGLPDELAAAIARARQRTAAKSSVASLTASVLEKTAVLATHVDPNASRPRVQMYWLCAVAASVGLVLAVRPWGNSQLEPPELPAIQLMQPVYSTITTVSLTQVGYGQVQDDLDRADVQIEEASEALQLAAVRVEIQKALDEFYDWSE